VLDKQDLETGRVPIRKGRKGRGKKKSALVWTLGFVVGEARTLGQDVAAKKHKMSGGGGGQGPGKVRESAQ